MITKYNNIPFRFDIGADVPLPIQIAKRSKELHSEKWNRGYPDLLICTGRGGYGGLYLELKATDGVQDTEHTRRQAHYHAVLRGHGYKVLFVCGLKETKEAIKAYMKLKKNKVVV